MREQGLLSMCYSVVLLVFLFSGLPIPAKMSDRIGLTPFITGSYGAPLRKTGGNLAQEYTALCVMGPGQGSPSGLPNRQASETEKGECDDIAYERYEVYGSTLEELQAAVTDLENGAGPNDEEEGGRYAAYVQAKYEIDFYPVVKGCWGENGEVAVELGTRGSVRTEIHMFLPAFHPSDPKLKPACEAEEARIEKHEMEHVAIFRLCGDSLENSLSEIRAIGKGQNLWIAMISARRELDEVVGRKLEETIESANCMNNAIDMLTNHGLGLWQ